MTVNNLSFSVLFKKFSMYLSPFISPTSLSIIEQIIELEKLQVILIL